MRITSLLPVALMLTVSSLSGALFYVSPEEPVSPHFLARGFEKKAATFSFATSKTEGRYSYNTTGTQVPLLEQYGTGQVGQFYKGLSIPAGSINETYFGTSGSESVTNPAVNATLRFDDPNNYYHMQSYHMAYTHYIFSGLFLRLHAQFVDQIIAQKPLPNGPDRYNEHVQSFADHFDQILGANNLPATSYNNRKFSIERAGYFLGWHGHTKLTNNLIKEIGGSLMTGYTFKPTHFDHPLSPAFLPHNQNHGYSAQIDLVAQVTDHVGVEAAAGTTSYGRFADRLHIVRDDTNAETYFSGLPLLGTGRVLRDPGSVWVFETGLSFNRFLGFFITAGYHFSYQERTVLTLEDSTVLTGSGLSTNSGQQNARLNSDPRLVKWKNHTVFARVGYTPSDDHRFVPQIDFAVHWPVMGQCSCAATRIYIGSGELSIRWTF